MAMGSEDTNDGKLYSVYGMTGMVWSGLQSFTLKSIDEPTDLRVDDIKYLSTSSNEPEAIDLYCDHLPFIEGTLSFALKDAYISKKLLRPMRRWSRKKAQQKKRKIAKEKKYGLLHKEA